MKGKKKKPLKLSKKDVAIAQLQKDNDAWKATAEQQRQVINQLMGNKTETVVETKKVERYIPSYVI